MANTATIKITATLLPTEISKVISNVSNSYTPANSTEGWYYHLTDVTASSADLIAAKSFLLKGSTLANAGVNTGASIASVAPASDKVKFLCIQHMSTEGDGTANIADSIYIVLDASASAADNDAAIEIGPGEIWYSKMNCPITDIHVISAPKANAAGSAQGEVQAQVYAIKDDL